MCARGRQRLWYTGQREKRGNLTYTHLLSGIEYHRGEMIINLGLLTQQKRIYINTCPWSLSSGAPPCFYRSPARTNQEKFGIVKLSQKTPQVTLLNVTWLFSRKYDMEFSCSLFSFAFPSFFHYIFLIFNQFLKQLCSNPHKCCFSTILPRGIVWLYQMCWYVTKAQLYHKVLQAAFKKLTFISSYDDNEALLSPIGALIPHVQLYSSASVSGRLLMTWDLASNLAQG